jgi:hypothetical protein
MPHKAVEQRRAYQRQYMKAWYQRNRERHLLNVARNNEKVRLWFRAWKRKQRLACQSCGESDPCCLDFHHLDRKTKRASVARMVADNRGKRAILAEIERCVVLCANCHRKAHAVH